MAKKIDLDGLEFYKGKENAMVADEYSSSNTYALGDYVYHAGTLYKCTTAITSAEAWTSGHWTAAKLAEDVTAQSENIESINNMLKIETIMSVDDSQYTAGISSSNKWSTASQWKCAIIYIPDGVKSIKVLSNASNGSIIAFLTSTAHTHNSAPSYASGWTNTVFISANTEKEFEVPYNAKYFYFTKSYYTTTYIPQSIKCISYFDAETDAYIPLGLHTRPNTVRALNIVKRCRQMTDIKWTPAVDLPRYMFVQRGGSVIPQTAEAQNYLGTFKAGVEYTGIPYGRVSQTMSDYGYDYGTVGNYIGFDTFISSVSNPKSRLSLANVGSVANHQSVIYASVCSGLTCYALGVSEVATANIGSISGMVLIGKLNDNGTLLPDSALQIGDILNKYDDHTAIITDIIRDSDGTIKFVELSDASTAGLADKGYADGQIGGLCRRKGWTKEQIFASGSWGDYSLYHYRNDVSYTPSPYVNVGDEFESFRIEHFPIMPYEGNGFVFKTGYIPNNSVKLVINLGGYDYVKVFKDGTEISGSPFAVTTTNDEIDPINVTEIGAGNYTAYLCNISNGDVTNLSYTCKWSIGS